MRRVFPAHVRSGGNFISSERIGNVAFMFRATEATRAKSIFLPLQALFATSLVFHGVFCEVTFHPSTPGSTRWLCRSTFATNEGKNASIILNARLRL
jgi:hypothetical protein